MLNVDTIHLDEEEVRRWARDRFPDITGDTRILRVNSNAETVYLDAGAVLSIPYDNPATPPYYEMVQLEYNSFTLYTPDGLIQVKAEYAPQTNVLVYKIVPWPV